MLLELTSEGCLRHAGPSLGTAGRWAGALPDGRLLFPNRMQAKSVDSRRQSNRELMGKFGDFLRTLSQPRISAMPSAAVVARLRMETPKQAVDWMWLQLFEGEMSKSDLQVAGQLLARMSYRDLVEKRGEERAAQVRDAVTELCRSAIRVQSDPSYQRARRAKSHEHGIVRAYGETVLDMSLQEYALVIAPSGRVVPTGWLVRTQLHKRSGVEALVFQAALEYLEECPSDSASST